MEGMVRAGDLHRGEHIPQGFLPPMLEAAVVEDVVNCTEANGTCRCVLFTAASGVPDLVHLPCDAPVPVDRTPVAVPAGVLALHLVGREARQ